LAAGYLGLRAYREKPWLETPTIVPLPPQCPEGQYRCRDREVQVSTGDVGPDGKMCMFKRIAGCSRACSSSHVVLTGITDPIARVQLCDAPRRINTLVSEERSFLGASVADAQVCDGDGYIPTDEGFDQCVAKSASDPSAAGVVTGRVRCRYGAVATTQRSPMLIKREEAIAVWCKRDPLWASDAEAEEDDFSIDAATDGALDVAPMDAKTGG
ncbi:MAG: hypothetical protein ACXWP4_03635, partial [Polyangiales bacterium]